MVGKIGLDDPMTREDARSMACRIAAAEIVTAVESQLEVLLGTKDQYTKDESDMIAEEARALADDLYDKSCEGTGADEYRYRFCGDKRPLL